jgi:hypothetical protein
MACSFQVWQRIEKFHPCTKWELVSVHNPNAPTYCKDLH